MDVKESEKFFKCGCQSEGILISRYEDEEEFYFSYWRLGIDPIKLSFWMRLKLCWLILFKGNYYDDEVILDRHKAREMVDWLGSEIEKVETVKMQRQRRELEAASQPRKEVAARPEMEQ